MSWGSNGDPKRVVPLVIRIEGPDGRKRTVSFPGGIDRSIAWLTTRLLYRAERMGYRLHPGWCYGYYDRFIAGTKIQSFHGKGGGRAIDINAPVNGRGTRGNIPKDVVQIFKSHGFEWGGDWDWTDPMHFQASKSRLFYWRLTRKMKRQERRDNKNGGSGDRK